MIELKNIHGIVVNSMKYKENNLILKLYTRELGMVSLLVRNKKIFCRYPMRSLQKAVLL